MSYSVSSLFVSFVFCFSTFHKICGLVIPRTLGFSFFSLCLYNWTISWLAHAVILICSVDFIAVCKNLKWKFLRYECVNFCIYVKLVGANSLENMSYFDVDMNWHLMFIKINVNGVEMGILVELCRNTGIEMMRENAVERKEYLIFFSFLYEFRFVWNWRKKRDWTASSFEVDNFKLKNCSCLFWDELEEVS